MWVLMLLLKSWLRLSKVTCVITEYDVVIQGKCYMRDAVHLFYVVRHFRGTALCYIRLCIFDLDLGEHGQCIRACVYHLFVWDQYPWHW